MLRRLALVVFAAFALVLAGCARGAAPPAAVNGPKSDRTNAANAHLMLRFAIYFLPKAKEDPAKLARELVRTKYSHLALVESPADSRRPAVAILPTEIQKFAPPSRTQLELFSRGLEPKDIEQVIGSKQALVFVFLAKGDDTWRVHREALELVGSVAERAGGVVWDEDTREMFSLARWRQRASIAAEAFPDLSYFITVHGYRDDEDGLARLVTLGMAKFGLPDISLENVPISSTTPANALVNLVCQTLFEANQRRPGPKLAVDVAGVKSPRFRKELGALPGSSRVEISLASARPEPGDADNALYEIVFPAAGPGKKQEAIERLLATVLGKEDSVIPVEHDAEMLAASKRARERLLALKPHVQKEMQPDEVLQVKLPFPVPGGGNEWMWVEVVEWNGKTIRGILQNTPFQIPDLAEGARVEGSEDDVFDYILRRSNGTEEGNETGRLMRLRQTGSE